MTETQFFANVVSDPFSFNIIIIFLSCGSSSSVMIGTHKRKIACSRCILAFALLSWRDRMIQVVFLPVPSTTRHCKGQAFPFYNQHMKWQVGPCCATSCPGPVLLHLQVTPPGHEQCPLFCFRNVQIRKTLKAVIWRSLSIIVPHTLLLG